MNLLRIFSKTKAVQATRHNTKPGDKLKVKKTVIVKMEKPIHDIVTQFRKDTIWTVGCVTNNNGTHVAYVREGGCCALSHFVHIKE